MEMPEEVLIYVSTSTNSASGEDREVRLLVTGGGTGGHIYPALALAKEFGSRHPHARIAYVGSQRGLETRVVPQTGLEYAGLPVTGIVGRSVTFKAYGVLGMVRSLAGALKLLRRFRPDLVLGTGGYVSVPVVLGAQMLGIPTVIQEQNVVPGTANRLLSRRANAIFVPSEDSIPSFPRSAWARAMVAGNPVRKEFERVDRDLARRQYGIEPDEYLVVIMSGSGGAATMNRAAAEWFSHPGSGDSRLRVLYATGKRYYRSVVGEIGDPPPGVRIVEYIDDASGVLAAADLLVCRAGAMTLAEATFLGLPMIVVPSPNVAHKHQGANARALAKAGAAIVIEDGDLSGDRLESEVTYLVSDADKLRSMSEASRGLADPGALDRMVDTIEELMGIREVDDS